MDKQNAIYTHSGTLHSLKKEGNSGPYYNMDDEDIMLREIGQLQKKKKLYDFSYRGELVKTRDRKWNSGYWGQKGIIVLKDEKSSGDRWWWR